MRPFLAHAFIAERRPDEAIPLYQKALEIRKGVEHSESDADFAVNTPILLAPIS